MHCQACTKCLNERSIHYVQDYDVALQKDPNNLQALLRQGKMFHAMQRTEEAQGLWMRAAHCEVMSHDIALIIEAQALLRNPDAGVASVPAAVPAAPAASVPTSPAAATREALSTGQPIAASATDLKASSPTTNGTTTAKGRVKGSQKLGSQLLDLAGRDPQQAINEGVELINVGKLDEAETLLDAVIAEGKLPGGQPNVGAYVSRGTARALLRNLSAAVADFTEAVQMEPRYSESWKRRGQARSALGENEAALQDLKKAEELTADRVGKADCCQERGTILQKQRNYRLAAVEFEAATRLDPRNAAAMNMLGLCYTSQGRLQDGIDMYKKALRLDPSSVDTWSNLGIAHKEIGQVAEAEKAFAQSIKKRGDAESSMSFRMIGELRRGLGEHCAAIHILDRALAAIPINSGARHQHYYVELSFLRGACYHALGYHKSAVRDYNAAQAAILTASPDVGSSPDARQQQSLAFYQRELAQYVHKRLDWRLNTYFLDKDISPVFKENWCKKSPPDRHLMQNYTEQSHIPADEPAPPPQPDPKKVAQLVRAGDLIGDKLRYGHQGFLANKRQLRMGGLAAIELAQVLRSALKYQRVGMPLRVPNDGASGETSASGSHPFGWRDAMDILVRWRQLSEPNDQVIWVDLLTKQEFEAGFGSHTPIFSGQTQCVRYYMNFERALGVFKTVLLAEGRAFDAHNVAVPISSQSKKKAVASATTAEQLHKALGVDCWAVVPIESISRGGHSLEGTRLTVVRVHEIPDGYEVSIRTPVTPPRWIDFDEELRTAWEVLMGALVDGNRPAIATAALHFAYYWYNFMPLARGTAVVGGMFLQAVFLAADMPVTASIPKGYQTDWEAILSSKVGDFVASVSAWMLPREARPPTAPQMVTTAAATLAAAGSDAAAADSNTAAAVSDATVAEGASVGDAGDAVNGSGGGSGAINGHGGGAGSSPAEAPPAVHGARPPPLETLPEVEKVLGTLRARLEALNGPDRPRLHTDDGKQSLGSPLAK